MKITCIDSQGYKFGKSGRRVWVELFSDNSFVIHTQRRVTKKQIAEKKNPMMAIYKGCQMQTRVRYSNGAMGCIFLAIQELSKRAAERKMKEIV